jgi:hypothetical protein
MGIEAEFSGRCRNCDDPIEPGQEIEPARRLVATRCLSADRGHHLQHLWRQVGRLRLSVMSTHGPVFWTKGGLRWWLSRNAAKTALVCVAASLRRDSTRALAEPGPRVSAAHRAFHVHATT